MDVAAQYLADTLRLFRRQKSLGEGAMAQLGDEDTFRQIDAQSNSVAIIVKHLAGNMRSRWTDFLTTDGEKPDRNRDQEFVLHAGTTRADVMRWWEEGWACVFGALEPLRPEDFACTVTIRGEAHTVLQAIQRQVDHHAYHVGQIVFLAKHLKSAGWKASASLAASRNYSTPVIRECGSTSSEARPAVRMGETRARISGLGGVQATECLTPCWR